MHFAVRSATETDASFLSSLTKQLGYEVSVSDTSVQLAKILSMADHCVFVATANDEVIGWVAAFVTWRIEGPPFVTISGLVVDENFRGQGAGKALIKRVEDWCRVESWPALRLRSRIQRKEAHAFYRHLGFAETKQQLVFEKILF